jgi:hypothetical protein
MKKTFARAAAVATGLALSTAAWAYIEVLYPLQQFMNESEVIAVGAIEKTDAKSKACVVKITKTLKGKCAYEKVRINVGAGREWHPEAVAKHLVEGAPVVIFYNAERRGEIYLNRFFMQLYGDPNAAPDKAWWNFTHIEIHCNRTYNGSAEDLTKLVTDVLAGKRKAPAPDPKIPAIKKEDIEALPAPRENCDPEKLPPSFRR